MEESLVTRQDFSLRKMWSRMIRVARLDGETFRELRDDPRATAQSVSVVAITSLCYGLGLSLLFLTSGFSVLGVLVFTLTNFLAGILIAFIWSGVTFLLVTRLFRKTIGYLGFARPFFFSWAPGLLFLFVAVPNLTFSELVRAGGIVWVVVASVVAVKSAGGVSTVQSMGTFTICAVLLFLAQSLFPLLQLG